MFIALKKGQNNVSNQAQVQQHGNLQIVHGDPKRIVVHKQSVNGNWM